MKRKLMAALFTCVVASIFLNFYVVLIKENIKVAEKTNKMLAWQKLTEITDKLQGEMNRSFEYTQFLELMVRINHEEVTDDFVTYASMIIETNPTISSVQLAPQAVVKYIYPVEGNEKAIGHDLLHDSNRAPFVEEAIKRRTAIAQGPVETRQGKVLIFNRKAIFVQDKFWGLAIVTINFNDLLRESGISQDDEFFSYALSAKKADGDKDYKWGNQQLFVADSVQKEIDMAGQSGTIAIYPKSGWTSSVSFSSRMYCIFGFITILIISMLTFFYSHNYLGKIELARRDSLTKTLNVATFKKYVQRKLKKSRKISALIIIDLNKFKNINDNYGHPVGDAVIIESAERFRRVIGKSDYLSRIGGDEYAVFLNNVRDQSSVIQKAECLVESMKEPMLIDKALIHVNISLGYAIYPEDGETYEIMYHKADERMYECKKGIR